LSAQSEYSYAGRFGHLLDPVIRPLGYDWKMGGGLKEANRSWAKFASRSSLFIWFVLTMQCMSTVAIAKGETGDRRWPIFMIVYMNGLAYVV
jgi:ferrous iron transport protein B